MEGMRGHETEGTSAEPSQRFGKMGQAPTPLFWRPWRLPEEKYKPVRRQAPPPQKKEEDKHPEGEIYI